MPAHVLEVLYSELGLSAAEVGLRMGVSVNTVLRSTRCGSPAGAARSCGAGGRERQEPHRDASRAERAVTRDRRPLAIAPPTTPWPEPPGRAS